VSGRSGSGALAAHSSRGAAFGDVDNDGDVDVLVFNMNEPPSLLRNDRNGTGRWIAVRLQGTRSDRAALGATVRVTANGRTQARVALSQASYYSHDDLRLHFGLGAAAAVDAVEVRWPSGAVETVRDLPIGRVVTIKEGAGLVEK
jgi:enediyne biosynthesis protein E4